MIPGVNVPKLKNLVCFGTKECKKAYSPLLSDIIDKKGNLVNMEFECQK